MENKVIPMRPTHYKFPAAIDERIVIVDLVKALADYGMTLTTIHRTIIIHRQGDEP